MDTLNNTQTIGTMNGLKIQSPVPTNLHQTGGGFNVMLFGDERPAESISPLSSNMTNILPPIPSLTPNIEEMYVTKDFHNLNHSFSPAPTEKMLAEAGDPLWGNFERRRSNSASSRRNQSYPLSKPSSDTIADDSILNSVIPPNLPGLASSHYSNDSVQFISASPSMPSFADMQHSKPIAFNFNMPVNRPVSGHHGPDGQPIKIELTERKGCLSFEEMIPNDPYYMKNETFYSAGPYIKQEQEEFEEKFHDDSRSSLYHAPMHGHDQRHGHRRQRSKSLDDMHDLLQSRNRTDAASIDSGLHSPLSDDPNSPECVPLSPGSVTSDQRSEDDYQCGHSGSHSSVSSKISGGSNDVNFSALSLSSPPRPNSPGSGPFSNPNSSQMQQPRVRAFSMDDYLSYDRDKPSNGMLKVRRRSKISTVSLVSSGEVDVRPLDPTEPTSPKKKHKKQGVVCANCHKSKTKCCGGRPCQRCVRLGRQGTCIDRIFRKKGRPKKSSSNNEAGRSPSQSPPPQAQAVPELVARFLALHRDVVREQDGYLSFFDSLIVDRLGRYKDQLMHLLPTCENKKNFQFTYELLPILSPVAFDEPQVSITQLNSDGNLQISPIKPTLHQMPVALVKINLRSISAHHYEFGLFFNDEFIKLFGLTPEEGLRKFSTDSIPFLLGLVHESDWKNQLVFLRDFLQGVRDQHTGVCRCLVKNGKARRCLLSYRFFRNEKGNRFRSGIICCVPLDETTSQKVITNRARSVPKLSKRHKNRK